MSKVPEKYELWELTLAVSANGEELEDGAKARWTPLGLDLPETTTLENVKEILRAFKAWETTGTVALADLLAYVKRNGWESEVEKYLAQLEFDLSAVRKAQTVGEVLCKEQIEMQSGAGSGCRRVARREVRNENRKPES
jgi:hypothetical protein